MEYGHFKRRDRSGDNRDRSTDNRDRGDNRDRSADNRDRSSDNRDRGGFRDRSSDNRDRGGFRDRGDFRSRERDSERDHEESVFSKRVRAGKRRTYFFDVRKTKGEDFFITITESTRREDGYGYKRHKIFLYKEDFNRFAASLNEVVNHVKTDLMPDFDYEEFDRRQAEWEAQNRDGDGEEEGPERGEKEAGREEEEVDQEEGEKEVEDKKQPKEDDEMAW